ncbi:MAG: murein biosynthesis integral membrane protein MurJ [Holosporaceae bacterium]|jgi:putative peptidoglycan lipid II flippase|nr:murein biosynthesis integral membrane protein MurJ [Holosporaceae bacterium]
MSLIKSVFTVGGWTLAYRISSLIRDSVQSRLLGAGMYADVFSLAFKFANILRKLFAEGSFNASFLPIFANVLKEKGHIEAQKLASQVLTWLVFAVSFLMVICLICYRQIMQGFAPGVDVASDKFEHLVQIGRICSPYIAASFLAALFAGILNTLNKFALPAAAQLTLNFCVIIAIFLGAFWFPSVAYTMAWATFFGGVIQVVILWSNVRYCGFKVWFDVSPMMNEVKSFFKKLVSGAIGAGVWQLNVVIDLIVLSFLPTGSISYFYYTDHVNQLPIGILGIAFSTALLPPITRAIAAKNNEMAQKQMNFGLLFAFIFTLPSAIMLISLSEPITGALYGGGNFGPEQVAIAAPTLAAFAIGLPAYMATKVFSTTFFAHKNTRTPLIGGIISIITNLLFIGVFMPTLKHTGIALATSLSSWCNVVYLLFCLRKLGTMNVDMGTAKECGRQFIASVIMMMAIIGMNVFAEYHYHNGALERNITLLIVISVGLLVFYVIGRIFGIFKFFGVFETIDKKDEKLSQEKVL